MIRVVEPSRVGPQAHAQPKTIVLDRPSEAQSVSSKSSSSHSNNAPSINPCGIGAAVMDSSAANVDRRLSRKKRKKKRWAQHSFSPSLYYRKWRVWLYRMSRWTYRAVAWFGNFVATGETDNSDAFFFAEDEIVEAWRQAEYLVENDLDQYAYADIVQAWQLERERLRTSRWLQESENTTNPANKTPSSMRWRDPGRIAPPHIGARLCLCSG